MTKLESNRLAVLAGRVRDAHANARRSATDAAEAMIAAGHALMEAKAALPHGHWLPWLADHVELSERTAQYYIRLARLGLKSATIADLGIRAALAATSTKRPPLPKHGESIMAVSGGDNPDTDDTHIVIMWAPDPRPFIYIVYMFTPAGKGVPETVSTFTKPVARSAIRPVFAALGFQEAGALYHPPRRPAGFPFENLVRGMAIGVDMAEQAP